MTSTTKAPEAGNGNRAALLERLRELSDSDQRTILVELVIDEAASTPMEQPLSDPLEAESPFFEVGFNSLTAVELRNRIAEATGLQLNPMLLFDYPTPAMVADHLREQLLQQ
jgi:acyl carrier protein